MPKETLHSKSNNAPELKDATVGEKSDYRVDKEDKISYEDYRNFVDSATFMACQEGRGKMHPALPDKD